MLRITSYKTNCCDFLWLYVVLWGPLYNESTKLVLSINYSIKLQVPRTNNFITKRSPDSSYCYEATSSSSAASLGGL